MRATQLLHEQVLKADAPLTARLFGK